MKSKIAWGIGIIIGIILIVYIIHVSNTSPVDHEHITDCDTICKSYNYQYGVCRDEVCGCASDELDLGKNKNGCVNASCCCVMGCDYMCKDNGYQSGYCNFGPECKEGEVNLGLKCKSGWPTTAFALCCCKPS